MSSIERAFHRYAWPVEHMGIDHRRRDVFVAEKFLNGPDVIVCFEEVGGKSVTKAMDTDGFAYVRESYGGVDRCLGV
jgi:hypothetical protein